MNGCTLCPRRCGADRTGGESGFCGGGKEMRIARAAAHMWEEPPISGTRGSGTIFFTGCSLGCIFCQNMDISRSGTAGRAVSPEGLAEIMSGLDQQGVHNISFVTGSHYIPQIISALELYRPRVPVVWNSGGYESGEGGDMLAAWVGIWLPDYKYGLTAAAEKYSAAPDYPETAMAAIKRMRRYQPENIFDTGGIMQKGVLVRHLVLPLNVRNSFAALESIAAQLPEVPVSLMSQYTPVGSHPDHPELERRITPREYMRVCTRLGELELDGFMQDMESSGGEYIPQWDMCD